HLDLKNVLLALFHGLKFQQMLLKHRPKLVYMPISETSLGFLRDCLFLMPLRLFGRPTVVHLHGGYFDTLHRNANPLLKCLMRVGLNQAARAIVLSDSFRPKLAGLLPPDRIRVVPYGIGTEIFEAAKDKPRNRATSRRVVLYLGTLVESKGFLDLL